MHNINQTQGNVELNDRDTNDGCERKTWSNEATDTKVPIQHSGKFTGCAQQSHITCRWAQHNEKQSFLLEKTVSLCGTFTISMKEPFEVVAADPAVLWHGPFSGLSDEI